MNTFEIKKAFLRKLELFYRNFGNKWNINDFVKKEKEKEILKLFLFELSNKGIVSIIDDNGNFEIIDLPSKHEIL